MWCIYDDGCGYWMLCFESQDGTFAHGFGSPSIKVCSLFDRPKMIVPMPTERFTRL